MISVVKELKGNVFEIKDFENILSKTYFCFAFQAATHIHRFRSLDENVLRMSELASEGTYFSLKLFKTVFTRD